MKRIEDLIALFSLNFSPAKIHGWIPQRYFSNGKYVVVVERANYSFTIYVYSLSGKMLYILNSFKELEPLANEK